MTLTYDNSAASSLVAEIKKAIVGTKWDGQVFLTGGMIRDLLLGVAPNNIDLCIPISKGAIEFATWLVNHFNCNDNTHLWVWDSYGMARVLLPSCDTITINIIESRKIASHQDGCEFGTIDEDALTRDFTINAMYANITTNEILDPTNKGLEDLSSGVLRTVKDGNVVFANDSQRIMRAFSFASKYNLKIEKLTWFALIKNAWRIKDISSIYMRKHMDIILMSEKPSIGLWYLIRSGAMKYIIPSLPKLYKAHSYTQDVDDLLKFTFDVVDNTHSYLASRYAALLSQIGTDTCITLGSTTAATIKDELANISMSDNDIATIVAIIRQKNFFDNVTNKPSKKQAKRFVSLIGANNATAALYFIIARKGVKKVRPATTAAIVNAVSDIVNA